MIRDEMITDMPYSDPLERYSHVRADRAALTALRDEFPALYRKLYYAERRRIEAEIAQHGTPKHGKVGPEKHARPTLVRRVTETLLEPVRSSSNEVDLVGGNVVELEVPTEKVAQLEALIEGRAEMDHERALAAEEVASKRRHPAASKEHPRRLVNDPDSEPVVEAEPVVVPQVVDEPVDLVPVGPALEAVGSYARVPGDEGNVVKFPVKLAIKRTLPAPRRKAKESVASAPDTTVKSTAGLWDEPKAGPVIVRPEPGAPEFDDEGRRLCRGCGEGIESRYLSCRCSPGMLGDDDKPLDPRYRDVLVEF